MNDNNIGVSTSSSKKEAKKNLLYYALNIVEFASLILFMVSLEYNNNILAFISWSTFWTIFIFLLPLKVFIDNYDEENLHVIDKIILGIRGLASLLLIESYYNLFFSKEMNFNETDYLSIVAIIFLVLSFLLINISSLVENFKTYISNKAYIKIVGSGLMFILSCLLAAQPIYSFYEPKTTVSLHSLNTPYTIKIDRVNGPYRKNWNAQVLRMNRNNRYTELGEINNPNLLDQVFDEISGLKVENIRNLNKIKFLFFKEDTFPYYILTLQYDDLKGSGFGKMLSDGYIYRILILNENLVIINNYHFSSGFLASMKRNDSHYYILKLSEPTLKALKDTINRLDKTKE